MRDRTAPAASRGFVLQPTYRMESGRPVVLLHGVLESGGAFLVRDDRQRARLHVPASDAARAAELGADVRGAPGWTDMRGNPVAAVEMRGPADAPALRDRLTAAGVACFEADVRFAYRYLIDRGVRGSLEIRGTPRPGDRVAAVFDNPEIGPADWKPRLSVLSLDIETDPRAKRILSVALSGCGAAEVLLITPPGATCPAPALACADERALLEALAKRVRELDPDVITGWNVVDFDLAVLHRAARRLGVGLDIGRMAGTLDVRPSRFPRSTSRAVVPGRLVMDGIDLVRGAYLRFERFALDFVAREVLGEGKTMTGPGRVDEILRTFRDDRRRFVDYNLKDARLVLEILERLQLVELSVERSRLTGMPPDRVGASIAAFDFLYLSDLHRRRIVAPSVAGPAQGGAPTSGGHVLEPAAGLYRNVLVFDFKSLYPSIIRTFQIDPLGRLPRGASPAERDAFIAAPNGALFRREPGILPRLLDELFPRRESAKRAGDDVTSQAIKILMNSFYGVLGTNACRFAHPDLANAITGFGRELLLWCKRRFESRGCRVIYGDTDSLFVLPRADDTQQASAEGARLVREINAELSDHIAATWRVESRLELELEKVYLRFLLPALRHGTAGARKRYAGLVEYNGKRRVVFTGLEAVRRDWTELARRVQRELYERLFTDRPVDTYLRRIVADLRGGRFDSLLVYRKALRKRLESYTAATPPHVAAARKMRGRPGRIVAYVMTTNGAEPAAETTSPMDHEHYVQRQIRPVAEPILTLLGLEFDRVVGDDAQLRLF